MILLFFLLWILLSGEINTEICIIGAVVSVLLYLFGRKVLGFSIRFDKSLFQRLWGGLRYLIYLFWEILKAGFIVMKMVYTKGNGTEPVLVYFRTNLTSHEAKVALANSITLTAGTITVMIDDDILGVHALDRSLAVGIESSDFERKLKKLER